MTKRPVATGHILICMLAVLGGLLPPGRSRAADHNDPNAVNSIFADIAPSAADLYDMFGFPSDDKAGGEKIVLALTFASIPQAGVFDTDLLYKVKMYATPRVASPFQDEPSLGRPGIRRRGPREVPPPHLDGDLGPGRIGQPGEGQLPQLPWRELHDGNRHRTRS